LLKIEAGVGHLTTLKEGYPGGPVSVAVVGDNAFVLEGQMDALFEPKPTDHITPFHATLVKVPEP
jgi:hypothetical protein